MIELNDLTVRFGGVVALNHVSAKFTQPVTGIIGPNGAGKTTLMNAVSGFVRCSGKVNCAGTDITRLAPHKRAHWGLRRSFQKEQIAEDLSVLDNLRVIHDALPGTRAEKNRDLEEVLNVAGLGGKADVLASELNTFERRLADVARCLLGKPKIVMFDEPGGALGREETDRLGDLILRIHDLTGAMTLMIDHDVDLVERICSETLVLDFGSRIALGPTREVLDAPEVQAAYLGIEEDA